MSERGDVRRFVLGFVKPTGRLDFGPADASCRAWVASAGHAVQIIADEAIAPSLNRPMVADPPPGMMPAPSVYSPRIIARMIQKRLAERYPDETIEVDVT